MLLEKLTEYAERLSEDPESEMAPPMYQYTRVPWIIDLDQNGNLRGVVRTSDDSTEQKKKKKPLAKRFAVPHVQRSSGVRAKLLADQAQYVLGIAKEKGKAERAAECFDDFIRRVKECADQTDESAVKTVLAFLENLKDISPEEKKNRFDLPHDFDPGDVMTFRVEGQMPVDLPSVRYFWAENAVETDEEDAEKMQCIVCGRQKPAERRLQYKVKGIPGGQTAGMAIISANSNVFESYGLEESLIAPTCRECSEKFTNAANQLLSGKETCIRLPNTAYVFWTKQATEFSFAYMLSDPDPGDVKALIASAWKGKKTATEIRDDDFYAASFAASGSRVAVRDWVNTTITEVRKNLARYFLLQKITGMQEEETNPLKLYAIAAATERDANDISPNVPKALVRTALKGEPLPDWLMYKAIKRTHAEQRVTRPQAALIKMVLVSNHNESGKEEDYMVKLDQENKDSAYLCGRLFAVLESVQRLAIPGAGATITDRFYGTASSAPASVFGRLLRTAQNHMGKLRHTKTGAYHALQQRMEEIMADLPAFPKTLSLQEQGLFSLGYYHQRAFDREQARSKKEEALKEAVENDKNTE